jgi:hypothetical protein
MSISPQLKKTIKQQQGFKCFICLDKFPESELEIHHIIFKSKGGTDERENLCALSKKYHRLLHQKPEFFTGLVFIRQTNLINKLYGGNQQCIQLDLLYI